jgi:hypothetical protein
LRFGEIVRIVLEVGEAALRVQRDGVIDLGADAIGREVGAQVVALPHADHVLVEDVARSPAHARALGLRR